jgi:spore coat protein CotH
MDKDSSDLQAMIDGLKLPAYRREAFLFDNINIPAVLNYLAVNVIIEDWDHVVKNHYLYRDTRGTGEWMFIA